MGKKMIQKQIPNTDSIKELARFWDENDITNFEDLLEEVNEPIFAKGKDIKVHLLQEEFESLEKLARQKGLKHNDLIREWVLEKLNAA